MIYEGAIYGGYTGKIPSPYSTNIYVSMGAWMASNWGVVMLGCAILFAAVKWAMTQRSGAVGSDAGPVVTYRRYNYVNVKLVR